MVGECDLWFAKSSHGRAPYFLPINLKWVGLRQVRIVGECANKLRTVLGSRYPTRQFKMSECSSSVVEQLLMTFEFNQSWYRRMVGTMSKKQGVAGSIPAIRSNLKLEMFFIKCAQIAQCRAPP